MAEPGRPTKLTPELQEALCTFIRQPMAATHAAARVGISETTYFRWMAEGADDDGPQELRDFREAVTRAKADAFEKLLAPIMRAGSGYMTTKLSASGKAVEVEEFDWRAAAWLLERMAPDEFGNRQRIDHGRVVDDEKQIEFDEDTEAAGRAFIAKATGYEPQE